MKPLILFGVICLSVLFSACSSTQQTSDLTLPQLIYQHPLPAYPKSITVPYFRIPLEIRVSKEGTVSDVRILTGSGFGSWDSAATAAIRNWKYTPARVAGNPISIWLHQTAVVKFSEPQYMILAEIICAGSDQADSVYQLLQQGMDFSEAAKQYSIGETRLQGGLIGSVNIQIFPESIKNTLSRLDTDSFTSPIPYGDRYAIFLRRAQ